MSPPVAASENTTADFPKDTRSGHLRAECNLLGVLNRIAVARLLPFNRDVYSGHPSLFGADQPRYMVLGRPQILAALLDIEAGRRQEDLQPLEPSLSGIS
jgi:hypothetical protein